MRSKKPQGVASYSGREGSTHHFSVTYEDRSLELLTVTQLRSNITADVEQSPGARAVMTSATALKPASLFHSLKLADVTACLDGAMPGLYERTKLDATVSAAEDDEAAEALRRQGCMLCMS